MPKKLCIYANICTYIKGACKFLFHFRGHCLIGLPLIFEIIYLFCKSGAGEYFPCTRLGALQSLCKKTALTRRRGHSSAFEGRVTLRGTRRGYFNWKGVAYGQRSSVVGGATARKVRLRSAIGGWAGTPPSARSSLAGRGGSRPLCGRDLPAPPHLGRVVAARLRPLVPALPRLHPPFRLVQLPVILRTARASCSWALLRLGTPPAFHAGAAQPATRPPPRRLPFSDWFCHTPFAHTGPIVSGTAASGPPSALRDWLATPTRPALFVRCGARSAQGERSDGAAERRGFAMGAGLEMLVAAVLGGLLCASRSAAGAGAKISTTPEVTFGTNVVISCNISDPPTPIKGRYWMKDGVKLEANESALELLVYTIPKVDHETSGEYHCIFETEPISQAIVFVKVLPYVTAYKKSEHGNEGDTGVLICRSHSYPPVAEWLWFKMGDEGPKPIVNGSEDRFYIKSEHNQTELRIVGLDLAKDPGEYTCNATNEVGPGGDLVSLRVRSRLAALWPFLGIVAEVLVLVTIIFIYEKKRKPDEVVEDDDGGSAPLKSNASNHKDQNVRQRNAN